MSTRSLIAAVRGDALEGRYHHYDGYPTGLAVALLRLYRGFGGDLDALRKALIDDHPAGWSSIHDAATPEDLAGAGYTENGYTVGRRPAECYCHGDRAEEPNPIECRCLAGDPSGCDPLFLEWAYVLNGRGLDVYKSVQTGLTVQVTGYKGQTFDQPGYRHAFVGTLPWDADEAAVEAMEERGHEIHEAAYEEHGSMTVS